MGYDVERYDHCCLHGVRMIETKLAAQRNTIVDLEGREERVLYESDERMRVCPVCCTGNVNEVFLHNAEPQPDGLQGCDVNPVRMGLRGDLLLTTTDAAAAALTTWGPRAFVIDNHAGVLPQLGERCVVALGDICREAGWFEVIGSGAYWEEALARAADRRPVVE